MITIPKSFTVLEDRRDSELAWFNEDDRISLFKESHVSFKILLRNGCIVAKVSSYFGTKFSVGNIRL
jgi:hypothetical protein